MRKYSIFSDINSSLFELRLFPELLYQIATFFFFKVLVKKMYLSQPTSKHLRNQKQNRSSKLQPILQSPPERQLHKRGFQFETPKEGVHTVSLKVAFKEQLH